MTVPRACCLVPALTNVTCCCLPCPWNPRAQQGAVFDLRVLSPEELQAQQAQQAQQGSHRAATDPAAAAPGTEAVDASALFVPALLLAPTGGGGPTFIVTLQGPSAPQVRRACCGPARCFTCRALLRRAVT